MHTCSKCGNRFDHPPIVVGNQKFCKDSCEKKYFSYGTVGGKIHRSVLMLKF